MSRTAAKPKQRRYLEIVVRFNRDIPTLVASSRVPEQTQLDTWDQLVSMLGSLHSYRSVTLAEHSLSRELLSWSSWSDPPEKNHRKLLETLYTRFRADSDHLQGNFHLFIFPPIFRPASLCVAQLWPLSFVCVDSKLTLTVLQFDVSFS